MNNSLLPDSWKYQKLEEIGTTLIGLTYSPSNVSEFGTLVLRSSNIQNNQLAFDNNVFVDIELPDRVIVKENDLLICVRNGSRNLIGKCTLIDKKTEGSAFGAFMSIFRSSINEYVFHVFQSEVIQKQIRNNLGATINQITNNDLANFYIPVPPLSEQQKIAQALTDADNYISALEKLIEKKKMIKEGLMVNLLTGKQRLKEFAFNEDGTAKGYKDSELGKIPEDWEIFQLKDLTYSTAGGTPSTLVDKYWGGENPWMSSGELHLKEVFDVSERITDLGLENSSTKYVPKNSVLIGLAGQGKTRGTVAISRIRLCTNQSIAAIFPSPKFNSDYLYYNLDNRYEELRSLSTGDGGRGGLNLSIINNLSVPFPNLDEQNAIVNNLKTIDNELNVLNTKLSKANLIKQGMMQKLLTGEIRLA